MHLALPTWGKIHTVSVIHQFISYFFRMQHPVRWSFIQEKFSPFLSSLFCRKNSSSKPRRINTISNNEENRSPLHNVILQDVIVHNYATVNDIKKVVSFFIIKTSVLKTTFSKKQDASQITTIPPTPLMFISTPRRKLMPLAETKKTFSGLPYCLFLV